MGHTGWLGRHPSPYSMRYTGPLEDPASPWIMGTRGPLGVPRFFMGKEQGGILEGLARPYDRCRSHGVARPICSPTHQHCVLLAGPAISSQKRTAVKPGRAAPSMPYGFLSPCLYHAVWHDMTEGAVPAAPYTLSPLKLVGKLQVKFGVYWNRTVPECSSRNLQHVSIGHLFSPVSVSVRVERAN